MCLFRRKHQYHVNLCGMESFYTGLKKSYPAGKNVVLYYTLIATDTSYSFYLDDQEINFSYVEGKGFKLEFPMPDHDVKVYCKEKNDMEYIPDSAKAESGD